MNDMENYIRTMWQSKRLFKMQKDKFKPKMFLYSSTFNIFSEDIDYFTYKMLLENDVYSRYYKMNGFNVFFTYAFNDISRASFFKNSSLTEIEKKRIDKYQAQINELGLSVDIRKQLHTSSPSFVTFAQKFFLYLFEKQVCYLSTENVYTSVVDGQVYNSFEVDEIGNTFYAKNTTIPLEIKQKDVVVLDCEPFLDSVVESINNLNILEKYKKRMVNVFSPFVGLEITFVDSFSSVNLVYKNFNPEYLAGLNFIALNPDLTDISLFVSPEETRAVSAYLEGQDLMGVFSGTTFSNPLINFDIPVILSKKWDEAIHYGYPQLSDDDFIFSKLLNLDVVEILDDNTLINSDFLTGCKVAEAHQIVIDELSQLEYCKKIYKYQNTKIVLSNFFDYGLLIPLYKTSFGVKPINKKYLPLFLKNKIRLMLEENGLLHDGAALINGFFNDLYTIGLCSFISRVLAEEEDIPEFDSEYFKRAISEYYQTSNLEILDANLYSEVLMPLVFSKILEQDLSFNTNNLFGKIAVYDSGSIVGSVIDFEKIVNTYSSDALRLYILNNEVADSININHARLMEYQEFINYLIEGYKNINPKSSTPSRFFYLSNQLKKSLENNDLLSYSKDLILFSKDIKFNLYSITFYEELLKLLYILIPHTVEYIYINVLKSKHFLLYEEWTL